MQGLGSGVAPSAVSFAIVMKAHGDRGDAGAAVALLRTMQAAQVPIDTVCWNTAVSACAGGAAADWQLALALLEEAKRAHAADVVTFNATLGVLQLSLIHISEPTRPY